MTEIDQPFVDPTAGDAVVVDPRPVRLHSRSIYGEGTDLLY